MIINTVIYGLDKNMMTPYEVAVKTIIPAIRSMIVKELYLNYKLKQKEIANLLYLTQAVVSYYLSNNRGKVVNISEYNDVTRIIKEKTKFILDQKPGPSGIARIIIEITHYFMKNGYLCHYHKILEPELNGRECGLCKEIAVL